MDRSFAHLNLMAKPNGGLYAFGLVWSPNQTGGAGCAIGLVSKPNGRRPFGLVSKPNGWRPFDPPIWSFAHLSK